MQKTGIFCAGLLAGVALLGVAAGKQESRLPASTNLDFDRVTPEVLVIRQVAPAVVNIQTNRVVEPSQFELFGQWYRTRRQSKPLSQGSGVMIDAEGYLLTNEHVIRNADQIKVFFNPRYDKEPYLAEVINTDRDNDLALLKISRPRPFPVVPLGRSDDLMIGEKVLAIGNPYGESNTVTTGILSASGRDVQIEGRTVEGLIQTDASINPGNSGGPLLNINGELIGINNAIHRYAEGIGFAIPVDRVIEVLNTRLIDPDRSRRVWFGIQFGESETPRIRAIQLASPADLGGLQVGDRILEVERQSVASTFEFWKKLLPSRPGDEVQVIVDRNGSRKTLSLRVAPYLDKIAQEKLGVTLHTGTPLRVRSIQSLGPAARIGIQVGDTLDSFFVRYEDQWGFPRVENFEIRDEGSFIRILDAADSGTLLGIRIHRDGEMYKGEFEVP